MPPLIHVDALTVRYPTRLRPTIDALTLTLNEGETVLLLGASGSGKSTLALTLNGLVPQSVAAHLTGRVVVDGLDTQSAPVAQLAQRVGIVFQEPESQFVTLGVEEEIVFGLENLNIDPAEMSARVEAALAAVEMRHTRRRAVHALSGGEKQRIALASLLAMEPQVLVFDEPTANLDPVGTRDVFALLATLKAQRRHTMVLIEHKLDEAMPLIDRVVVLGTQGHIVADGDPHMVFREHAALLAELGVWIPQVAQLAADIRAAGVALPHFPVTLAEGAAAFAPLVATMPPSPSVDLPIEQTPPLNPPVLEIRDLTYGYGRTPVLNRVSLTVPRGDWLAVVGANGAGKTTLAQLCMHILTPPRGTVLVGGRDVTRIPPPELLRQMGFVFQNPEHQFITGTVADELRYGLRVLGLAADEVEARTMALLERFGLARYAPANPFTLSHGEKRRLSVASMLAVGQELLVLDEPTFGQDQRNSDALMELLASLHAEGRTIVMITHDMTLVAEYARTVAVLAEGKVLFHGTPTDAFATPTLLAQARLTVPPLAQVAAQLPDAPPLYTRKAWVGAVRG